MKYKTRFTSYHALPEQLTFISIRTRAESENVPYRLLGKACFGGGKEVVAVLLGVVVVGFLANIQGSAAEGWEVFLVGVDVFHTLRAEVKVFVMWGFFTRISVLY